MLLSFVAVATAVTLFVGTSEGQSEYQAQAANNNLWSIDGATLVSKGIGTSLSHNSVTYNLASSNNNATLALDGTLAKFGGTASTKPSTVTMTFAATGQPWTPSDKDIASVTIYTAGSVVTGTSISATFGGTASPTTYSALTKTLAAYTFAVPAGKENAQIIITVGFGSSAKVGWISSVEVAYALGAIPTALTVTTQPTKTQYLPGEVFDPTGMVVRATYSDNSTNNNFTEYGLIPPSGLCQATNTMIIYALANSTVRTSVAIAVTGGGYYAGIAQDQGIGALATKKVTFRNGENFDPDVVKVFGYLACLTTGGALQSEQLLYDASGALGFKVMNAAKTSAYTASSALSTGSYSAVAMYTGTAGPNPDPEGALVTPSFEIAFTIEVLDVATDVTNTTSTDSNTFSGATENLPKTANIGGITWYLFLTAITSGASVGFESSGSARGTSFNNASAVKLISDPYNYYGDILIKSVTVTLSTTTSSAVTSVKVGTATSPDTTTVSSGTTNTAKLFDQYPDSFNLNSANKVGYGYGHITIDITGLTDTVYIKTISVDSNSLPNPRRAVTFGTLIRDINTCSCTLKQKTDLKTLYDDLPNSAKTDYVPYMVVYDRTSLDTNSSIWSATVTAVNKYTYIQSLNIV